METTLNDPAQLLSLFLKGVLGRSGRKRARKATKFMTGNKGLVSTSSLLAAAGVAWGIYDSLKAPSGGVGTGTAAPAPVTGAGAGVPTMAPPLPVAPAVAGGVPDEVRRIVRLALSAARADGQLSPPERALILEHAGRAGVDAEAELEIQHPHPLAEIVRGVADEHARHDLYTLAFTIVRADETVTGSERIYLAQLAHQLGLEAETTARLEAAAIESIDATDA